MGSTYKQQHEAVRFDELKTHIGHQIVVVRYGTEQDTWNVAIECEDCNEVLDDADNPRLNEKGET